MEQFNSSFGRDKNKIYDKPPLVRMHAGYKSTGAKVMEKEILQYPTEVVMMDSIVRFEPENKMEKEESQVIVAEMVEMIKEGRESELPPIFVSETKHGYIILDGHHRYHAHEIAGSKFISVKVVPQDEIKFNFGNTLED
jgi:uncharacterized ParB-like nuclease family protein